MTDPQQWPEKIFAFGRGGRILTVTIMTQPGPRQCAVVAGQLRRHAGSGSAVAPGRMGSCGTGCSGIRRIRIRRPG